MENLKEYVTVGGFLFTVAAGVFGYGRLNQKVEDLKEAMDILRAQSKEHYSVEGKLKDDTSTLKEKTNNIEKLLEKMDGKLDRVLEARTN